MADEQVKISQLAEATDPDGTELVPVSQNGVTRKIAIKDFPVQDALKPEQKTYSANTAYSVPAGTLVDKVVIIPTAGNITVKIGTTSGGNDVLIETPVANGKVGVFAIDIYSDAGNPITLYISGISGSTKVIFFKRSI